MSSDVPPPPTASPATPPSSPSGNRHATDDFFDRIRGLGLYRATQGRWAAGVAEGLARRWDVDVVLVRGVFVALALVGGFGVAAYGLAWLFLPQDDDNRIHLQRALHGDITAGFIGSVILSLSLFGGGGRRGLWHDGYWFGWGPGGIILTLLIVGGVWYYARNQPGTAGSPPPAAPPSAPTPGSMPGPANAPVYGSPVPPPADPAADPAGHAQPDYAARVAEYSRRVGEEARARAEHHSVTANRRTSLTAPSRPLVRLTLGLALLAAAAILVVGNANDWSRSVGLIAAGTALAVIALGVIGSGLTGRRSAGLAGIGVILAAGTLLGVGADNAGVDRGQNLSAVGQTTWRPTTAVAAERQFNMGVGEATLWLTDPGILSGTGPVDVRVRMGAGHLTVVLPDDVASSVRVRLSAGEVVRPDGSTSEVRPNNGNHRQTVTAGPEATPRLVLDVQQGVGQMEITTAARMAASQPDPAPSPATAASPRAAASAPSATPAATPTATK